MRQAQERNGERGGRRRTEFDCGFFPGRRVKNSATVIVRWGAIRKKLSVIGNSARDSLMWCLYFFTRAMLLKNRGGWKMAIFKGAGVAIITPFHEDGSVNYPELERILDDQIKNGTDAVIICGTTGEASVMTEEEHIACIAHTVKYVNHRIPVIAGTGSNSTKTAIYLSQESEKAGVDGLLIVTPYYNKATQKGLVAHYKAVSDAVHTPILMYNVPSRTGCNILPETAAEIVKTADNVVGIKEATGNISQIEKLMEVTDGKIDLYSGNDDQIIPLLALGGLGVISVLSNVAPKYTHDMCYKFFDGDVEGAREMQKKAGTLISELFSEVNPIPVKKAMNLMGWAAGPVVLPLTELEPQHTESLKKAMLDFGIELKEA